ncbi:hypothetical protein KIF24_31880 [Micromonospora sp. Llam7]|uniref:WXG100-like domain-containing protein n=1 Tax=Micromonospora tarapacensis TaxID=2835305 RepID=UPI001C828A2F|nr:hypothetical protein [Micromonospora tarapacensis]MBX7270171.1 hypothetical protein [Micromonospora tarapacensis]
MTGDYYGWQPNSYQMYSGVSDDYAAERAAQATPYEPTAWDSVNIEQMWEYVRKESDERTTALADMWRRAASLLQATRDNLKRHADSLDARWQSPAARVFMSRVGATLHSLDEWKDVATNNATGLDQVASKIETAQREMKTLWQEYQAEQTRQGERRSDDEGFQAPDLVDWMPGINGNDGRSYEDVQSEFHQRAKNIAKPLADLYIDVYISNISRGGKFKGPTDAVINTPGNVPGPGVPGAPPPGAPGAVAGPNRPSMPPRADLPTRPDLDATPPGPTAPPPANLPEGVGLAGGAAAPVAPPPTAPPVSTAPNAPATPGPAVPPVTRPGPRPVTLAGAHRTRERGRTRHGRPCRAPAVRAARRRTVPRSPAPAARAAGPERRAAAAAAPRRTARPCPATPAPGRLAAAGAGRAPEPGRAPRPPATVEPATAGLHRRTPPRCRTGTSSGRATAEPRRPARCRAGRPAPGGFPGDRPVRPAAGRQAQGRRCATRSERACRSRRRPPGAHHRAGPVAGRPTRRTGHAGPAQGRPARRGAGDLGVRRR